MNTELFDQIAETPGRLDKEALLAKASEDDKRWIRWALDPAITFRVIVDVAAQVERWQDPGERHPTPPDIWWDRLDGLLKQLSIRNITGNAALSCVDMILMDAPTAMSVLWACRVINKDLRCNFGVSTVNKVFPGLIEAFKCALAEPYDVDKHRLEGRWMAQAKLDGLRMVVVDGVAYTRTGKVLESVGHILDELPLKDELVFDGEVMGTGSFDEASGKTRKKGNGPDLSLVYHIFDVIDVNQWKMKETDSLEARLEDLREYFYRYNVGGKYSKIVKWTELPSNPKFEDITKLRDSMIAEGYEGVMLKNLDAPYNFKRSKDLLKYKFMKDADGVVVDSLEGRGKQKGKLGSLVVDFGGVQTKVGSGFSDAQRAELWATRETLPGRWVECLYQDMTADGCLRFPIFNRWRPDKED